MLRRIKQESVDDPEPSVDFGNASPSSSSSPTSSSPSSQDQDEVIAEIPIRLLKPTQRLLYLLQHPLRPSNRPYDDAGPLVAVQHKHDVKFDMLQMKYQVSGEAFQHDPGLQESLTLTSSTVRPQGQLLVGRLVDGELLVRPFNAVLRMRPDFCQVDEERRRLDAQMGNADDSASSSMADGDKPAARAVTVKFQREESERSAAMRQRSHAFQQAQQAATPWTPLKLSKPNSSDHDDDDGDSDVEMDSNSSSSSSSSNSSSSALMLGAVAASRSPEELSLAERQFVRTARREVRQLVASLRQARASAGEFDMDDEGGYVLLQAPGYLRRVAGGERSDDLDQLHPPEYQNLLGTAPTSASATQLTVKPPATFNSPGGQRYSMPVHDAMDADRRSRILDDPPSLRAAHDVIRGRILGALVGGQVLSTKQLYERVGAPGKPQQKLTLQLVQGLAHLIQGNWVCPSDYTMMDRPRLFAAREWLLLQFHRSHRIPAAQPQLAGRLADLEFSEITERLCNPVLVDGVPHLELAQPRDVVFMDAEHEIVRLKDKEFDFIDQRLTGPGGFWAPFQMSEELVARTPAPEDQRFRNPATARNILHIRTNPSSTSAATLTTSSTPASSSSSSGASPSASVLVGLGPGGLGLPGLGMLAPPLRQSAAAAGGAGYAAGGVPVGAGGARSKFAPKGARGAAAKRGAGSGAGAGQP